eukprot:SAG31_NODE_21381_length_551_cov_0.867257_1_plen_139_part_01
MDSDWICVGGTSFHAYGFMPLWGGSVRMLRPRQRAAPIFRGVCRANALLRPALGLGPAIAPRRMLSAAAGGHASDAPPRVGCIGLGAMGEGMAACLLREGHPVTVVGNRRRQPVERLVAAGAQEAADMSQLAEAAEVLL